MVGQSCVVIHHKGKCMMYGNPKVVRNWIGVRSGGSSENLEKHVFRNLEEAETVMFKELSRMYPMYNILGPLLK